MFNETDLGFGFQGKNHFVFFGKKNCSIEDLIKTYPAFQFRQTKQTHSDILIQSTPASEYIESDAHYTADNNVALVVRTADCIPALVYSAELDLVLAVHAGWRGVENKILLKSLEHLKLRENLNIYVGPHILQNSFQVDLEVKNRLQPNTDQFYEKDNKFYIDLKSILFKQIQPFSKFHTESLNLDTQTDLRFNSYRRDKEALPFFCGRNLSYIVKTNE